MIEVAGLALDESVVESLASREDLSREEAVARGADVLRLVAASRAEQAARPGEPEPELDPRLDRQIRRATLARLWLEQDFEARHRPEDIPEDAPELLRFRGNPRYEHEGVTAEVCQILVLPPAPADGSRINPLAMEEPWRARAREVMTDLETRARRYVPAGDPDTCPLLKTLLRFAPQADTHLIRYEGGGFELGKCAEKAPDGTCAKSALDPDWEAAVEKAEPGTFIPPFFTQFGMHFVYLHAQHEPLPPGSPESDRAIRERAHRSWQRRAFQEYMERLRAERTPRIASGLAEAEQDGP